MQKQSQLKALALFSMFFLLAFTFYRFWLAYHTSFWSDEPNGFGWNNGPLIELFRSLGSDASPHMYLDSLLLRFIGSAALGIGIHPHLAMRLLALLFALGTTLIPLYSKHLSPTQKILWIIWTGLNVAITHMSINARAYSGMIFFGTCAVFAGVELFALEKKFSSEKTKPLLLYSILLGVSFTEHAFLIFPAFVFAFFLWTSTIPKKLKWTCFFPLLIGLALWIHWYGFYRNAPTANHPLSLSTFFSNLKTYFQDGSLISIFKQTFGSFSNPGKRVLIVAPFVLGGIFLTFKKSRREGSYFLLTFLAAFLPSILLVLVFNYHFAPRQTFGALGFWGWYLVLVLNWIFFEHEKNKRLSSKLFVLALFWIAVGALPLVNFIQNKGPFVDQAPHRVLELAKRLKPQQTLIVLNHCSEMIANFYVHPEYLKKYFDHYPTKRTPPMPNDRSKIQPWQENDETCFGKINENPDDPQLSAEVINNPERFIVFGMMGIKPPKLLQAVECYDERNMKCDGGR